MFGRYKAPIYTLRIGWGGDPLIVGDRMAKLYGSFHGVWIPFMTSATTGFSAVFPAAFDNAGAKDLTDKLGGYLGNFLRTGDPNGAGLVPWKPWESASSGPTQLVVDADAQTATIKMTNERTRYDDVLAAMEADQTLTDATKKHLIEKVLSGRWFSRRLDLHFGNGSPWVGVE